MNPRRLWVIAGGPRSTASSRHRLWNYRPFLERDGIQLKWTEYRGGGNGGRLRNWVARGRFLRSLVGRPEAGAVVLVQKVLPPEVVVRRWKAWGHRIVYDFDDALHEHFSWGESEATARRRRRRFDRMLQLADHVIAGSPPLGAYAESQGRPVEVMYPSLQRERFAGLQARPDTTSEEPVATGTSAEATIVSSADATAIPPSDAAVVLGWIGNVQSQHYLRALAPALEPLFARHAALRLCVCSSVAPELPRGIGARLDFVPWSEAGEIETLRRADIAISPMGAEPWSRARGGRVSVLLAMAAGRPVCAAPGGGLEELAGEGGGVRFVSDPDHWEAALDELIEDGARRREQGRAARATIDDGVRADVQYPRLRRILFEE